MTVIPMLKNALVRVLRILSGVPIVSLLMGGLLFLVFSTTLSGRCIGLGAVLLGGILFGSVGYWNREWFRTVRVRLLGGLLPLALLLFTVPALMAPRGTGADDGHVQSCFLHDKGTFPAFSPWNIIPEMDQIKVGTSIIPLGDPHVDFAKTKRVRSLVLPVYEEMEGWQEPTSSARTWNELPHNARAYISRISELTGADVAVISVGSRRDETIFL